MTDYANAPILAQSDIYTVYGCPDGTVSIDMRGYDQTPLRLRSPLLQDKFRMAQTPEEIHQEVTLCLLLVLTRRYGEEKALEMLKPSTRKVEDY